MSGVWATGKVDVRKAERRNRKREGEFCTRISLINTNAETDDVRGAYEPVQKLALRMRNVRTVLREISDLSALCPNGAHGVTRPTIPPDSPTRSAMAKQGIMACYSKSPSPRLQRLMLAT